MDPTDLCYLPATELADLVRRRVLSPVEVVETFLARIERLNPVLNAYCTLAADQARAAARAAEEALVRGDDLGPLHGVPVHIKDVIFTKGIRTTRGSRLWADLVPDENSPIVARLKQAGAIVLGKTNTPELGWKGATDNPLFGVTRNPWNLERTPGGSSGGTGAAIAAGLGPLGPGTDGAGSIRIPASFCGIFGLKPTFGLVPYYPPSAADTVSHVGPMARTVRDAALLLDVIAGPDQRDRHALPPLGVSFQAACAGDLRGQRVAWSPDLGYAEVDAEVARITATAAARFSELDCALDSAHPGFADPNAEINIVFYASLGAALASQPPGWEALVDPPLVEITNWARRLTAFDWLQANVRRNQLVQTVARFFERYDLLLTPTIAVPPFGLYREGPDEINGKPLVSRFAWTPFTYPWNLTGNPAATVPCGWTADGLPVGLQIVGRRFEDALVLRAAAAFEALAPWADRRPPVG